MLIVKRINANLKFWVYFILFIFLLWLNDRFFGFIVTKFNLNNGTRNFYADFLVNGAEPVIHNLFFNWIPQTIVILLITIYYLRSQKQKVLKALNFKLKSKDLTLIISGIIIIFLYQTAVKYFIKGSSFNALINKENLSFSFFLIYFSRFCLSSFLEEVTFRAGLFYSIKAKYSQNLAIFLSLSVFALSHLYGGLWLLTNSIILGLFFTFFYIKTEKILPGSILHILNNIIYAYLNY